MILTSRYGDVWGLVKMKEGYYLWAEPEHTRVGYNDDNSICFVDPPGGPFLQVGDELTNNEYIEKFIIKNQLINIYVKEGK